MDNNKIQIINKEAIKPKHQCEHEPYEYYKSEVSKPGKDNMCNVSVYRIPPHKANYPYHYHLKSEEVFYIISGSGILETPDGNKPISAGDIIICPPNENGAHRIVNSSDNEMLIYLDCDTVSIPDIAYYPSSNKVGIILNNGPSEFFERKKSADYYEGE